MLYTPEYILFDCPGLLQPCTHWRKTRTVYSGCALTWQSPHVVHVQARWIMGLFDCNFIISAENNCIY